MSLRSVRTAIKQGTAIRAGGFALCCVLALVGPGWAASVEKFSIFQGAAIVGTISATTVSPGGGASTAGSAVIDVDYAVNENGRGPKHHEMLRVGSDFIPVEWTVTGTSLMGGPVSEKYSWYSGRATWTSQADHGEVTAAQPSLYVVNDDSPWALFVYARALLATSSHTLDVLPSGSMRLSVVRDQTVGAGKDVVAVTIYRIDGAKLEPEYVMLDASRRLFAAFAEGAITVRDGYERDADAISKISRELGFELAREEQHKLRHHFDEPVRIRNVRIFDPKTGQLSAPSSVVTARGRIAEILPVQRCRLRSWGRGADRRRGRDSGARPARYAFALYAAIGIILSGGGGYVHARHGQ